MPDSFLLSRKRRLYIGAMQVPFYKHGLTSADAEAIAAVLDTPFLTSAGVGRGVEDQLRSFFDVPHAKLTNSWTNGAVATLLALDIGPGDEVIVPAMTFIASANVVELVGARPVFVDVLPNTFNIDPKAVAAAVTERTKAVIPVHLYGQMVDMVELRAAVGDGIKIIEDAAHCFEGERDGYLPGRHGDAAIFSFYATKNVTCGEGGAVITRDGDLFDKITQTILHGMSAGAADRFKKGAYRPWDMMRLGTKANLPDLLAALLPSQIDTVRQRLGVRAHLAQRYAAALDGTPFQLPVTEPGVVAAHHLFPVGAPAGKRDMVIEQLNSHEINVTVNYTAVHETTYYREKYGLADKDFPVAHDWGTRTFTLPLFPGMETAQQDYVIDVLKKHVIPQLA